MRELRSLVGLTRNEFHHLLGQKRVIIWGGNGACTEVIAALIGFYGVKNGEVLTLVSAGLQRFDQFTVYRPDEYLKATSFNPDTHLVIVASVSYRLEIVRILEDAGFLKGVNYLFSHEMFRQRMVVRIVDDHSKQKQELNTDALSSFLGKNATNLQGSTLEITGYPDPFSHGTIDDLVGIACKLVPVTVSSFIPSHQLLSLASLYHVRLRLFVFTELEVLRRYFPNIAFNTDKMYFDSVQSILMNVPECCPVELVKIGFTAQYLEKYKFLSRSNIIASTDIAYPLDYSPILNAIKNDDFALMQHQQSLSDFDLNVALEKAEMQKEKSCMCERVYPVLNADASWAVCHLHFDGKLCEKSADVDYDQILQQRRFNSFCRTCQQYGLHRLDVSLL